MQDSDAVGSSIQTTLCCVACLAFLATCDETETAASEAVSQVEGGQRVSQSADGAALGLLDRGLERAELDIFIEDVRNGRSRVTVLRGEPGIGKTALLEYLAAAAEGCRVIRATGVESEMELAFAGLHQLCSPFLGEIDRLPTPQYQALGIALGLETGAAPDHFFVGLAALTLLSRAAEVEPLTCLVDDAQWLDTSSAQTIAFIARRLEAEHIGIVFAVRDAAHEELLLGLPEIRVSGLERPDAEVLLTRSIPVPFDPQIREQLLTEAHGNPLALLELPRGIAAGNAYDTRTTGGETLGNRIERQYASQIKLLPRAAQQFMLVAAAEPTGDRMLLARAVELLGVSPDGGVDAADSGLLDLRGRVMFRHPIVRAAAYRSASAGDRKAVHRALAEVTDPISEPDRRAWHRAQGSLGPDEGVALDLEEAAVRAQDRGGLAAAAAFMEESVALTPDPRRRSDRALAAAQASVHAGGFDKARELLVEAEARPLDALHQARIDLLRAHILFASQRGNQALPLLLEVARRLEPLDMELALDTYLDAFAAAMFAGRFADGPGVLDVAMAAERALESQLVRKGDLLLHAVTTRFIKGHAAAAPLARAAVGAYRSEELGLDEGLRSLWLANATSVDMFDYENWVSINTRYVEIARASGALSALPLALNSHVFVALFDQGVHAASTLVNEANAISEIAGNALAPYGALSLAAWQGREARAIRLLNESLHDVIARGEGIGAALVQWGLAVLNNALCRYSDALPAAREASADAIELGAFNWGLVELVEAAARAGDHSEALAALHRLRACTSASETDWGLGMEAYATALVSDDDTAEGHYRRAVTRLGGDAPRAYLARAHLLYGEWLRRCNRRLDAREQLRAAFEAFVEMGFEAFAERARRELSATGQQIRQRTDVAMAELTPQEAHIAQLAAQGLSNPEIGVELFLSHRTVEWHLGNVFNKLGIAARRDLRAALHRDPSSAGSA